MIKTNQTLPDFKINNQDSQEKSNSDYLGKWWVLYLYPKDNTPGCTTEALDFTSLKSSFNDLNCNISGLSPDTEEKHCKFIAKKELGIELLSDPEKQLITELGFWQLKKMAGHEYMGVVRSTLLVNPEGIVTKVWTKVRVKEHAQNVLDELKAQL
ncbi:peroxiredoxin [Fibrobacterales bacterium]|nr:peroxiredoxin [Fibrobacterales bacterium]